MGNEAISSKENKRDIPAEQNQEPYRATLMAHTLRKLFNEAKPFTAEKNSMRLPAQYIKVEFMVGPPRMRFTASDGYVAYRETVDIMDCDTPFVIYLKNDFVFPKFDYKFDFAVVEMTPLDPEKKDNNENTMSMATITIGAYSISFKFSNFTNFVDLDGVVDKLGENWDLVGVDSRLLNKISKSVVPDFKAFRGKRCIGIEIRKPEQPILFWPAIGTADIDPTNRDSFRLLMPVRIKPKMNFKKDRDSEGVEVMEVVDE